MGSPQDVTEQAARLTGRLAYHDHNKAALRDAGAITALLKILRVAKTPPKLQETVAQALTILAVSNEVNQDFIRCAPSACRACSTTGIRCMFMMHFTCAHRWIKTVQPA